MEASQRTLALGLLLVGLAGLSGADLSRPGGAGHSLLFRDHGVLIEDFKDLARDEFTFEAWVRTSDNCHRSAILSYALRPSGPLPSQRNDNHFTIFDPQNLVACHDFEYLDMWPDVSGVSCYAAFNHSPALPNLVTRSGRWHHLAVTWTAANNGLTRIFVDGLLRAETPSGKTAPLQPGGALMLGAEQDCYGGCTDQGQGYHGEMDEVRLWRTARTQAEILAHMRDASGLENHPDLAAYWKFNDPEEEGLFRSNLVAKDSSGRGNDIHLVTFPTASRTRVSRGNQGLDAGALTFRNNYAMNQGFEGMPDGDLTVEFWARLPAINASRAPTYHEFFSFATNLLAPGARTADQFVDDGILIERYADEFRGTAWLDNQDISTAGSISVHINANRAGMGSSNDHWVDFAVGWIDNEWHHVAATWAQASGEVSLYFDGRPQTPFWVSQAGQTQVAAPAAGGVDRHIAAGTRRSTAGSLVLGQLQESYGGGFSPQNGMHGDLSNLRVWGRVLGQADVAAGMFANDPPNKEGLAFSYSFDPANVEVSPKDGVALVKDVHAGMNDLYLGADAPAWVYSTAPLQDKDGKPVHRPKAGSAGHAMHLSDQQVLIHKGFADFPAEEITVEFWMQSADGCRKGVPFSYATGQYGKGDNSFLLFDYNDWGVSVMEDEGMLRDHTSGLAATDGRWHHVAVTWRSSDGQAKLYDNGREVWSVTRSKGKRIPSGGTLVVGREQDCEGGCFDSERGAAGDVQPVDKQEYGAQDFFGLIDDLRVWKRVRTAEEIASGIWANLHAKGHAGGRGKDAGIDPHHPDLVAFWNFDEGRGYTVKDITGHGHDLLVTQPPKWEVVRHLAVCGNGIVEGLEECDDGNARGGEGCSADCKVEPGWRCTTTSPSKCWKARDAPPAPAPAPGGGGGGGGPAPGPAPGPQPGAAPRHRLRSALVALTVLAAVGGAAAAVVVQRDRIYRSFPIVEDAVGAVRERLLGQGTGFAYAGGGLEIDPEDASDFTSIRPAPERGHYARLGDQGQ